LCRDECPRLAVNVIPVRRVRKAPGPRPLRRPAPRPSRRQRPARMRRGIRRQNSDGERASTSGAQTAVQRRLSALHSYLSAAASNPASPHRLSFCQYLAASYADAWHSTAAYCLPACMRRPAARPAPFETHGWPVHVDPVASRLHRTCICFQSSMPRPPPCASATSASSLSWPHRFPHKHDPVLAQL